VVVLLGSRPSSAVTPARCSNQAAVDPDPPGHLYDGHLMRQASAL